MKLSRTDAWFFVFLVLAVIAVAPAYWLGLWAPGISLMLLVILVLAGLTTVEGNEQWVVQVFGAYDRTLGPGLHLLLPGIETVKAKQTTAEQTMSLVAENSLTSDNLQVTLETELFYRLNPADPEAAKKATYNVELDGSGTVEGAVRTFAQAVLRSIVGRNTFEWIQNHQKDIDALVIEGMQGGVAEWGLEVVRHSVKEVIPPASMIETIRAKKDAELKAAAQVATANGDRDAQISRAEGDRRARILAAEAQAEAQRQDAIGEAAGIVERGKAMASEDGQRGAQYNLAEQAVQALSQIAQKGNILVVPGQLADVASLVKIGEQLLKKPPSSGG